MYLQLLHQSQPAAASRRLRNSNGNPSPDADSAWTRKETGRHGGRGDDGRRAADRFGFINAVMAHAREGGDPFDVEEVCGSEGGGFTQEGYAGTPDDDDGTIPTQQKGGRGGSVVDAAAAAGCPDWSPCDAMSSGGSQMSAG